MVCNRCIMVVKSEMEKFGYHLVHIALGEVELRKELNDVEKQNLDNIFERSLS